MNKYRYLVVVAFQVGCGATATDKQSSLLSLGAENTPATSGAVDSSDDNVTASTSASETTAESNPSNEPAAELTTPDDTVNSAPRTADAGASTELSANTVVEPPGPDNGGKLAWVISAAGEGHDRSEDIAVFPDGSLLVTGLFGNSQPSIVFGRGEPHETTLTANHSVGDMFITRLNADGSLAFAKNHNLTYPDQRRAIATLRNGSFVVAGNYWSGTVFGRGEPNEVATPETESGLFVAKHDAYGNIVWVTRVTGAGMPAITAVSDGFVLTGPIVETAVFGVGSGVELTLPLLPQAPPPDPENPNEELEDARNHFIAKLTADGQVEWVKRTGGSYWNEYRDIAALPDHSVVLTGTMDDVAVFGPGETGETSLLSAGENDVFVAKYHPDGSLAWATRAGGLGYDGGISLSALADQSVVVVGHYTGAAEFGAGETNATTLNEAQGEAFMAKYNPDGSLAFARALSGAEVRRAASLEDGSTLVTGVFWEVATFGAGELNETTLTAAERDTFLAKYTSDGNLAWVKQVVGVDLWNEGRGIAVTQDAVFIAGFFSEQATFAPGEPEEATLTDVGMDDLFVAKYWL